MAPILVSAERTVDAPADVIYGYFADMREHHPRFLPPAFADFQVEAGGAHVRIATTWDGAGGMGGFFERLFAPRVMRGIYADELVRLAAYAREQRGGGGR
ncbi:MAG TPA: hypothetical protein VGG35_08375 [Streptosporangiaceae bacterium]|jgi:hypothetical protein